MSADTARRRPSHGFAVKLWNGKLGSLYFWPTKLSHDSVQMMSHRLPVPLWKTVCRCHPQDRRLDCLALWTCLQLCHDSMQIVLDFFDEHCVAPCAFLVQETFGMFVQF